ncbi:hypothetical protein KEM52_004142 [Ascosphaera acerosa]|nr:hypothetical protein KEM52_004142 [Ascosphaera acerosa]
MFQKSNTELINGLKFNFESAKERAAHLSRAASAASLPLTAESESGGNGRTATDSTKSTATGNGAGSRSSSSNRHDDDAAAAAAAPYKSWTSRSADGSTLYVPKEEFMFEDAGLLEPRDQYDVTVKLFFLPGAGDGDANASVPAERRCEQTQQAIRLVCRQLDVACIDLLVVSWPGVSLSGEGEADTDLETRTGSQSGATAGTGVSASGCCDDAARAEPLETMLRTWRELESLVAAGTVRQLGLAEFDADRLAAFLARVAVPPAVNQIYTRDCCVAPEKLIRFAKARGIRLLTHNDCTDILPRGTTREILSDRASSGGAGLLAADNGRADDGGLKGDVAPQWAVKYTAVVKDRGVIENKGYIAMAELREA